MSIVPAPANLLTLAVSPIDLVLRSWRRLNVPKTHSEENSDDKTTKLFSAAGTAADAILRYGYIFICQIDTLQCFLIVFVALCVSRLVAGVIPRTVLMMGNFWSIALTQFDFGVLPIMGDSDEIEQTDEEQIPNPLSFQVTALLVAKIPLWFIVWLAYSPIALLLNIVKALNIFSAEFLTFVKEDPKNKWRFFSSSVKDSDALFMPRIDSALSGASAVIDMENGCFKISIGNTFFRPHNRKQVNVFADVSYSYHSCKVMGNYFEVTILDPGEDGNFYIGMAADPDKLGQRVPGAVETHSYAHPVTFLVGLAANDDLDVVKVHGVATGAHGAPTTFAAATGRTARRKGVSYESRSGLNSCVRNLPAGTTIGCGFDRNSPHSSTFYTVNGRLMQAACQAVKELDLTPVIGFLVDTNQSQKVLVNFGATRFLFQSDQVMFHTAAAASAANSLKKLPKLIRSNSGDTLRRSVCGSDDMRENSLHKPSSPHKNLMVDTPQSVRHSIEGQLPPTAPNEAMPRQRSTTSLTSTGSGRELHMQLPDASETGSVTHKHDDESDDHKAHDTEYLLDAHHQMSLEISLWEESDLSGLFDSLVPPEDLPEVIKLHMKGVEGAVERGYSRSMDHVQESINAVRRELENKIVALDRESLQQREWHSQLKGEFASHREIQTKLQKKTEEMSEKVDVILNYIKALSDSQQGNSSAP